MHLAAFHFARLREEIHAQSKTACVTECHVQRKKNTHPKTSLTDVTFCCIEVLGLLDLNLTVFTVHSYIAIQV